MNNYAADFLKQQYKYEKKIQQKITINTSGKVPRLTEKTGLEAVFFHKLLSFRL